MGSVMHTYISSRWDLKNIQLHLNRAHLIMQLAPYLISIKSMQMRQNRGESFDRFLSFPFITCID